MSACPASFSTATQEAKVLAQVFEAIGLESCPRHYNFHMHTHCSDGRLSPEALIAQAVELGLKGIAVTDHHNIQGYLHICRWIEDWRWRYPKSWTTSNREYSTPQELPQVWTGVEITAWLLETDVHILGYAFAAEHPALQRYLQGSAPQAQDKQAARVINAIHQAGGIAVLAHPARYRLAPEALIPAAAALGIDGVETFYAYDNPTYWRPSPAQTAHVSALADRHQLLSTCGTDTHGLSLTRRL
jgi:hypothetical protein